MKQEDLHIPCLTVSELRPDYSQKANQRVEPSRRCPGGRHFTVAAAVGEATI